MKRKKILYVITYLELGGAQTQLLTILKNLDKDRYQLYLVSGNSGQLTADFLSLKEVKVHFIKELVREINPFFDLIALLKLFKYIRGNTFDVVCVHSPKAAIIGRWASFFAGVKNVIYTVHGWPHHRFMHRLKFCFYYVLERVSAKVTDKIIVVSEADRVRAVKEKIAAKGKIALIHYGIDLERFTKVYRLRKYQKKDEKLIFIVACLKRQKGLDVLLAVARDMIAKDKSLKFIVAGDGPERKRVEVMINKFNLENNFILKGWAKDVCPFLERASLFLLTSFWEGLPVALIEAVTCGVPVVVTDTLGVRDIVRNKENGFIVPCGDSKSIVSACWDILDHSGEWEEKIEKSRLTCDFRAWDEKTMVESYQGLYEQI